MRRYLSALVAIAAGITVLVVPAGASAAESCGDHLTYVFAEPAPGWQQSENALNANCAWWGWGGEGAVWVNPAQWNQPFVGRFHTELLDNNYPMANSAEVIDPTAPANGGWIVGTDIYHPYWGTYCSRVWAKVSPTRYVQAVSERCAWTDGYE